MKNIFLILLITCTVGFVTAQEYNPFEKLGYKPKIATLSKGKYNEFFNQDSVVQIGTVLFNRITKEIVGFVKVDTMYSEATLEPELVSRWMSPDPLESEYTSLSPYNFVANNPILYLDPDGRVIVNPNSADAKYTKAILNKTTAGKIIWKQMVESKNKINIHVSQYSKDKKTGGDNWKRSAYLIKSGNEGAVMTDKVYKKMMEGKIADVDNYAQAEGGTFDENTGEYIFQDGQEVHMLLDKDLMKDGAWNTDVYPEQRIMTDAEREAETVTHEATHTIQTFFDPGKFLKKKNVTTGKFVELTKKEFLRKAKELGGNYKKWKQNYDSQRNETEAIDNGNKARKQLKTPTK